MHDVRPLECERTRHFISVRLDDGLSHFERMLVVAHVAQCETCSVFERRVTEVTEAVRSAPYERLAIPVQLPSRRSTAWRTVARATSVGAAAAVAVVAFLGFAAAPDRSGLQADHALIASALERPTSTNDLLIDVVRPTLASRATQSGTGEPGGIGAVKPPLQPGV